MKMATLKALAKPTSILLAIAFAFVLAAHAADDKAKKQQDVRKVANDTLERLYKAKPGARKVVENGAGYAVFNNMGVKILMAGSGTGKGIAVNNKTKAETFMKMVELQAGLGMGVKKFNVIFVFDNEKVLNNFINSGWELGGQANASAKSSKDKGAQMSGASSVADGIWMYQMTEKGLSAEITAKGTKYYKDKGLN